MKSGGLIASGVPNRKQLRVVTDYVSFRERICGDLLNVQLAYGG